MALGWMLPEGWASVLLRDSKIEHVDNVELDPCTLCASVNNQGNLSTLGIEPLSLTSSALAGRFFTTLATWEDLSLKGYISRKILRITGPLHFF